MARRRTFAAMERDAKAADLYRRGLSYRQIAAELGWRSSNAAYQAVQRAVADAAACPRAAGEARQLMLDRLQDYRRVAWRVASTRHYAVSQGGKVAVNPVTEEPLLDDGPVLAALDRLLKTDEREARLLGLDAPAQSRVQVITEDMVDAELQRLEDALGDHDGAGAAGAGPAGQTPPAR